ncbi:MAG: hypothetical protein ACFBZ8_07545 [Opitutales bacterium]
MSPSVEKATFNDALTGRAITQWTASAEKDQHLYFTSFSVTADDRWLVFISERSGHPNLHKIDRLSGEIFQVSQNHGGLLHAYVYPYGGDTGLSKASPALDPAHNRLFWIQDDAIWRADLDSEDAPQCLAALPPDTWSAFTHVAPDGKTICVPVTAADAFDPARTGQWEQMQDTVRRFKQSDGALFSDVLLIDTQTGNTRTLARLPFWVTHVQYDPPGSGRILFNQEGGNLVRPRVYALEPDGTWRPLYVQEPEEDWASHENWNPQGGEVIYHGKRQGRPFVAARSWEGELHYCHWLTPAQDFIHATPTLDGSRLLVDQMNGSLGIVDAASGTVETLCQHGSSSHEQDVHVHALTTPLGRSAIFTSDRDGTGNVYEVPLD